MRSAEEKQQMVKVMQTMGVLFPEETERNMELLTERVNEAVAPEASAKERFEKLAEIIATEPNSIMSEGFTEGVVNIATKLVAEGDTWEAQYLTFLKSMALVKTATTDEGVL